MRRMVGRWRESGAAEVRVEGGEAGTHGKSRALEGCRQRAR